MQVNTKIAALFLYCLAFFISCKSTDKKDNEEGKISAFVKSTAHTNIPGTHIFMIPPSGFKASTGSMKGFIKDETTTFLSVTEFKGKSFAAEAANNSAEKMKAKGFSVFMEEETTVGPYKARRMRIGDGETSTVWQLLFGDDSFAVMIMGIYPPHDEISGKQIAEAIETVVYDKDMVVDEMAGMNYTIKSNESRYKYLKIQAGLAFYSLDGKADLKNDDIPFLVLSQVPRENASAESFAETALESTLRNGFSNHSIKSKGFLTINNNSAYEMEVACILKGKPVTVYIAVVTKDRTAVMIQGVAKKNIAETITGFKDFADAIVIK